MKPDNVSLLCVSACLIAVVWGAVETHRIDTAAAVAVVNAPEPTPIPVVRCVLDSAQIARLVTCYEGGCFTPVGSDQ